MFGIGLPELILIMALALIVVGPDKLPDLARSIAKGVLDLKKTVNTLKDDLAKENPLDAVKPELEDAANSLKKQLGEPGPNGWTGIAGDYEIIDPHEQAIRDHDTGNENAAADIDEADDEEDREPHEETGVLTDNQEENTTAAAAEDEYFDDRNEPEAPPDHPAGQRKPDNTAS